MGDFINAARFPLVVLCWPQAPTAELVRGMYGEWDACLARGPHAVLVDLSLVDPVHVGTRIRKVAADQVEARRKQFELLLIAEARAVPDPRVREAVIAFDWVQGISFKRPLANFPDVHSAAGWLHSELARKGLHVAAHGPAMG